MVELSGNVFLVLTCLAVNAFHDIMVNLRHDASVRVDRVDEQKCSVMYQCCDDVQQQLLLCLRRCMIFEFRVTS